MEAKRWAASGVGYRDTSRLISRLRHRQFGILITTSYVNKYAYEEIVEDVLIGHINAVDSSIIPALISFLFEFPDKENVDKTEELIAIEQTCNMIKGTFACWIYSKLTGCTYLVRSGSTLFGNIDTGDFSSTKVDGICEDELQEGLVYCVTSEGLANCGEFETNSPFFL